MEKKKKLIILGVIILILAISGLTYAILTWTSSKINIGLTSGCFTIDYTKGQDISGNLKLINVGESFDGNDNFVIKEGMGLSYANLGIKSSCTIEGYGSLYLNVTTLSDSFKEGGDSNGALGYALLRNTSNLSNDKLTIENLKGQSFEIIDIKPITNTGTIKLVTEQLSNTELNKYLIVIFVISQAAGNSITSATFQGNISADAEQGKYVEPTPEYCFNITDKDETNKTASIASTGYKCYEGNSNGYKTITSVNIPSMIDGYTITKINNNAFCADYNSNYSHCMQSANLTNVTIPDSVTTIGDGAFNRNQLTSVTIPNSVTYLSGFYGNQLTEIVIPNSVTTIGSSAFGGNQLTSITIPSSVTTIDSAAFAENQITSVIIPDSVTTIGSSAFHANQLTSITIPDSVTSIGGSAFGTNQLTSITIPDSVTSIGGGAFLNNQLISVTIPDSVTTIGNDAFSYNNLNYVLINSGSRLTSIGVGAFSSSNRTDVNDEITYVDNPNLKMIYNNSNKSFPWHKVTSYNNVSSAIFVTGTTNAVTSGKTTYNAVTVTTGKPS